MNSVTQYKILTSRPLVTDGDLQSLFYIADAPLGDSDLRLMFNDALEIFKQRLRQLGRLDQETTQAQQDSLFLTLALLVEAKEQIRGSKDDV